jgi:tRNA threonylcarbamoyladenosine biosynthesis protein TsaB
MLLALDTSTRTIGIALYDGIQVLSESVWNSKDYHTVELAPAVAETLSKSGVSIEDLRTIVVALGPGSFTGLRIGLALAKGIALVRHLPLIGIPTLAVGWYEADNNTWHPNGDIEILTPEELSQRIQSPTLVCGELEEEERRLLGRKRKNVTLASPAQSLRRPAFLAELGWRRWQQEDVDDPATLAPFYLHYNEPIPG